MANKTTFYYNLNIILYIRKIAIILSIFAILILFLYYLTLADGIVLFGLLVFFPSIILGLFFSIKLIILLSKDRNLKKPILITISIIILAFLLAIICICSGYYIFTHTMTE